MVILYHYTSKKGCSSIKKTGCVRCSVDEGAKYYGEGVYLTKLNPLSHTRLEIAENNYDNAHWFENRRDKVQVALEFKFKHKEVTVLHPTREADVWKYDDGDLPLKGYFTGRVFVAHPVEDGYIEK